MHLTVSLACYITALQSCGADLVAAASTKRGSIDNNADDSSVDLSAATHF